MTTRPEVRARVVREYGGYSGDLEEQDGSSRSVTLIDAWRAHGAAWAGRQIVFPQASSAGNRVRAVEGMNHGVATLDESRVNVVAGETFELYPADLSMGEINAAISDTLAQTRRPIQLAVPLVEGRRQYVMPSWVTRWRDVRNIRYSRSPCVLGNEDFESWALGDYAAPTSWYLDDGIGVVREGMAASLRTTSGVAAIKQDVGMHAKQSQRQLTLLLETSDVSGTVSFAVGDIDSVAVTGTERQTHELSVTVPDDVMGVTVKVELSGDASVVVHRVLAVWGTELPDDLVDVGSSSYLETDIAFERMTGRVRPTVLLRAPRTTGQLVVSTLTSFSDLADDLRDSEAPLELLVSGVIFRLADREIAGVDASVQDRRRAKHGAAYAELASELFQQPEPDPIQSVYVGGA